MRIDIKILKRIYRESERKRKRNIPRKKTLKSIVNYIFYSTDHADTIPSERKIKLSERCAYLLTIQ